VSPGRQAPSLLRRLLTAIIGPLIVLAAVLTIGSAVLIHALTQRTSDRVLLGSLAAIAETLAIEDGEITLDLPPAAFGMLEDSERDNVYYSIRHGQTLLSGYRDLPSPAAGSLTVGDPQVRDAQFRGQTVRVAAVARRLPRISEPVVVQVAETLKARNKLQMRLALVLGSLVGLLVAAAAFLVPPAVAWGLRPLDRLRIQVAARTHHGPVDLSPLEAADAPREARPFVEAFNALLGQLEASTAGMRRFTSDASHQMRTPLAALRTHLALARRAGASPSDQIQALSEVDAAAGRLERLLAQLLSLARAEEQGRTPVLVPVDLAERLREAVAEVAPRALAAGVEVAVEAPPAPIEAFADPFVLGEVLANLLDNAVRYNKTGGCVVAAVRETRDGPQIAIEDDGPGVPEADRAAIFERFARLVRDGAQPGSGLGLAIVQALTAKLGGEVRLEDRPDGRSGLHVVLTLTGATAR
jgi:two-component system, OmpR family, sensor histidine kinase TctE